MSTRPQPRSWSFSAIGFCCFLILNLTIGDGNAQALLIDSDVADAVDAASNRRPVALLMEPETAIAAAERLQKRLAPDHFASALDAAQRSRAVRINPLAIEPDAIAVGDTLYLGLFDDVHVWATIDRVSNDINGVRSIRGRVQDSDHGTVLLSISEGRIYADVTIPELEQEFVISDFGEGVGHVVRDIDPDLKDVLESGPALIPPPAQPEELKSEKGEQGSMSFRMGAEPLARAETQVTIDLMVVYTPAARQWADRDATSITHVINQAIAKGQLVLDNSEVGISLNLVHTAEIDYTESGNTSEDLRYITRDSTEVRSLRDAHGADLVGLFARVEDAGGWAWILNSESGKPDYGFHVVRVQQAHTGYSHIHEIGHNMGAHHHKDQTEQPGPGLYSYSAGWRWTDGDGQRYCSVMTYENSRYFSDGRTHTRVPYFANPNVSYNGFKAGHAADGDNARTLVNTKEIISAYRGCSASTTPIGAGGSLTGTLTTNDCQSTVRTGGYYYDTFTFEATAGTAYTIVSSSSDFEPYLYLLNGAGRVLARDGDGGEGSSGRMVYTPTVSETLNIHVTSSEPGAIGSYRVELGARATVAAPSSLTAAAASPTRIDLSWRDNSGNESGFRIERKTGSGSWSQIDTVGANVTAFADTGLSASTTYTYRVRAYNDGGVSAYSNETSATTAEARPAAPSSLTAAAASTARIDLSWRDNSGNESGFRIERKTGSGSWSQIDTVGANVTAFADTGLSASTTYTYRVRAYNSGGASDYSNETSATTAQAAPAAPSNLTAAAASTTRIDLSWRDNSANESGFRIERKTGSGSWSQIATVDADVTAYADTGLSALTTYTYRVRAYNAGGVSAYSNETSADTEGEPPAAPAKLTAKAMTTSSVDLRWRDRSDDESGFRIDRKTGSDKWSKVAKVGADVTRFSDTGLNPESTYAFRVRALNAAGTSDPSNVAKTITAAPAAPSKLTAEALSSSRITLTWRDRSKNETGFRIYRKIESGAWSQIAKVGADTTGFVDTGLRGSTAYIYRVRAVNAIGKSKYSKAASAATR
jgi:hypothetical protein